MKTLHFRVQNRTVTHPVYFGEDIVRQVVAGKIARSRSKCFVVADRRVFRLHENWLRKVFPSAIPHYQLPPGERNKSEKNFLSLLQWLYDHQADRSSTVFAVGGGVVTDLVGFTASSYMRGIEYISIPTTLVAQVDAAIGGKTAINFRKTKNIVGAFYPPSGVICDSRFLESLSELQVRDGIIEALKILSACDSRLFHKYAPLSGGLVRCEGLGGMIVDAVRLKLEVVNRDPFEHNLRRVLNFGHTTGHAYEVVTGESHGKSVAFGILVSLKLSEIHASLPEPDAAAIRLAIRSVYYSFKWKLISASQLWEKILHDKKRSGADINFVLLKKCGRHVIKELNYRQFERGLTETFDSMKP